MEALKTETATLATSSSADLGFTVPRKEIAKVLATMARIAERKSSIAILANVAIRAYDDGIALVATDLNTWITFHTEAWGSGTGGVSVNAKSLADLVKKLPDGEVTLARSGNTGLRIASGGVDTTLIGLHERDFPKIPTIERNRFDLCDGDALGTILGSVLHSVCTDETRFHLNGVLLQSDERGFRAVSTDGHRLTLAQRPSASDFRLPKGVIIPAKAAKEISKLLATETGPCSIAVHDGKLFVRRGCWELVAKLIDAQFPPYEQVIPSEDHRCVTVERKPLVDALKRAKALTSSTRGVRLDLAAGKLTLTSDHPDTGTATDVLEATSEWCERKDATFRIGVNADYLLQAISEVDCKHVTIAVGKGELEPILVRGTEDACAPKVLDSSLLEVVMPMRI